jgi:hypothetical protein
MRRTRCSCEDELLEVGGLSGDLRENRAWLIGVRGVAFTRRFNVKYCGE